MYNLFVAVITSIIIVIIVGLNAGIRQNGKGMITALHFSPNDHRQFSLYLGLCWGSGYLMRNGISLFTKGHERDPITIDRMIDLY